MISIRGGDGPGQEVTWAGVGRTGAEFEFLWAALFCLTGAHKHRPSLNPKSNAYRHAI